jgi:hypothetical protein
MRFQLCFRKMEEKSMRKAKSFSSGQLVKQSQSSGF